MIERPRFCKVHGAEYAARWYGQEPFLIPSPCPVCYGETIERRNAAPDAKELQAEQVGGESKPAKKRKGDIPLQYADATFENYETQTKEQADVLTHVKAYARDLASDRRCYKSLVLVGNIGTGKTHLACSTIKALQLSGLSGYFATADQIVEEIKDTFGQSSKIKAVERFTNPHLLVIDEVRKSLSAYEVEELFHIINTRYNATKPTLLTTNLSSEGFAELVPEDLRSRLAQQCASPAVFTWSDHRRGNHS